MLILLVGAVTDHVHSAVSVAMANVSTRMLTSGSDFALEKLNLHRMHFYFCEPKQSKAYGKIRGYRFKDSKCIYTEKSNRLTILVIYYHD
ncbi:hypothetical protein T4B_6272 [Trichinella pseudospiralis]|uniref:Secreted protein n=1 Tax=Trichinella pseudospiralis TaxID=6337 RepID=A0A0V1IWV8_TRIPS|nr:hypothetical protein T4B_6272 [Trichinella pseudospiralis]KRZ44615.1 hypothetical protein T4C_4090 [Trichinella pseudospiralis]